jgi:hypothetical protein
MQDPVLPIPVRPPEPEDAFPMLSEDSVPNFVCVWLSDTSKRAFATDGNSESEIDYRIHRRWSKKAIEEFSQEYSQRMPGVMDASETGSLDALMHSICLNLRDEPHRRSWSYLFDTEGEKSYICIKKYAEEFCREKNTNGSEGRDHDDSEVIRNIIEMYTTDDQGPHA